MNRRKFLAQTGTIGALAAGFPLGCARLKRPPTANPQNRVWRTAGASSEALKSFDDTLERFMRARNIPAGALAVTRHSRLVYARGYAWGAESAPPVSPESLFRIASLSKPLTSAGVMKLVEEGKLRLDDRLVDLLDLKPPEGQSRDPRLAKVTVLQLLQHLGGWDRGVSFDPMFRDIEIAKTLRVPLPITTEHVIRYMTGRSLDYDPGARYAYSNFGYCLLGRVIEAASGRSYGVFMNEAVLRPLGISRMALGHTALAKRRSTEVRYSAQATELRRNVLKPGAPRDATACHGAWNLENMDAHGAWLASAVDLARFASAFDETSGWPLLKRSSIETTFAEPSIGTRSGGYYYGCGWLVRPAGKSRRNTWHNGSLPGTYTLMVRRHDGLNWVVLFNQRGDPSGLNYGEIDGALHQAANAVGQWPEHDLFPEYKIPAAPSRAL